MIDNHIHIGQFNEVYYDPIEVIQIVMGAGMEGLCFSSTTSGKEGIKYSEIEREISHTLAHIRWSDEIARPFFWYVPDFATQGVTVEKAMRDLPYKGIKLHPLAHHWDLEDEGTAAVLHGLFEYAGHYKLPVLIHTGQNGVDAAGIFSRFFPQYPEVKFILAHCRPLEEAISLLKNQNVYGDTAFLPSADFVQITEQGLSKKMVLGSDFPITHYFSAKYPEKEGNGGKISLAGKYSENFEKLEHFSSILCQK
jgi:predicted TIM-barrel fold metal-dependent hydrolase